MCCMRIMSCFKHVNYKHQAATFRDGGGLGAVSWLFNWIAINITKEGKEKEGTGHYLHNLR